MWLSEDSMFVRLLKTPGRYGGIRYWFECPRPWCRRRCSVLYREWHSNARAFTCRHCTPFRYETQVLGRADLIVARIDRLIRRLEIRPDHTPKRPKGMHSCTFERLVARTEHLVGTWTASDPMYLFLARGIRELEKEGGAIRTTSHGDLRASLRYER